MGTYAEDAPVCICTDLGASSAHSLHSHGVGGGQYSFGKILGVRWTIQRGRYSGSIQKIFPGVKMATHANVTFRTTITINGFEETRISDRYAELSTEQAKHLLIHEPVSYTHLTLPTR